MAKPKKNKKKGKPGKLTRQEFSSLVHGGGAYYELKQRTSPQQFKRLRREARRRGTNLAGLVSGLPPALRPLTQQGIARQARRTTRSAYAREFADLSQQEQRIRAISSKRATDNMAYARWLQEQQSAMQLKGKAADDMLLSHQEQMHKDLQSTFEQLQAGALARQGAQPGNVSNPGDSRALDLSPERKREEERLAAQRQQTQDSIGSGQKTSQTLAAVAQMFMAAQDQKRQSDEFGAVKEIGDERERLRLQRSSDTEREIARLIEQEIVKAQSNREFDAAVQKLGLDARELQFDMKEKNRRFGLDRAKFKHQMSKDEAELRIKEINAELSAGRLSETERHNLAMERLRLKDIVSGNSKAKGKDTTAWRQFRSLIGQSRMYGVDKPSRRKKVAQLLQLENKQADPLLIQAAIQVATGGADPGLASQIQRLYGFRVKTKKGTNYGNPGSQGHPSQGADQVL
jgi:hypothetical protein